MKQTLNQKGSAIVVVMMLLSALFLGVTAFYTTMESNDASSGALFRQKQNFYMAEGTRSIAVALTHQYLNETRLPTSQGLTDRLKERLPIVMPTSHIVTNVEAEILSRTGLAPIPNGPFQGMLAPQSTVRLKYDVQNTKDDEYRTVTHIEATSALAQVGLFQFMYFIDLDYSDFAPGPPMTINGRVHANGDICVGGDAGLTFSKITSAGRISHINVGNAGGCINDIPSVNRTYIATGNDIANTATLTTANSHGCKKCAGKNVPWAQYALDTWNGNVMDSAHGVNRLSLPLPVGTTAQLGTDPDPNFARTNDRNLRFLVDPVRPGEPEDVINMKFAGQADIRVIDGIWYLKDPKDPLRWPGVPIWSDHPGSFRNAHNQDVGQQQLRAAWNATFPWDAGRPRKFSYYEYDTATESIQDDGNGVISYGTLSRGTTGAGAPQWRPGFWMSGAAANYNHLCRPTAWGAPGGAYEEVLGDGSRIVPANGVPRVYPATIDQTRFNCTGTIQPNLATYLLNGTRSGFRDGHIYLNHQWGDRQARSKILPINFDAEAFQAALADVSAGELGSYFGASRFMGREFNGIVYLSLTYPDSETGYNPRGRAGLPPLQGSNLYNSGGQKGIAPTSPQNQQQAIPHNLCSDFPGGPNSAGAWRPFDGSERFIIPQCNHYFGGHQAYANAIRVINGRGIDPDKFTRGLSIVSNQSVYVTGSYNLLSDVSSDVASPWMPALIAGDQVTFQSDAWDDAGSNWSTNPSPRMAASSTYNMTLITGWVRRSGSNQLHAVPSLMENWFNSTLTFNGSIAAGYYPVYYRSTRSYNSGITYVGGARNVRFDPHYGVSANQPPGSPLFYVNQVQDWKAR